ncbi:MAG: hypothetical protein J6V90_05745 [Treponema sp.]|nr:hypothetical protein [Treponema sp.]
MKKFLLITAFFICSAALFAENERNFFGFQFALGSGYTFYGDDNLKSNVSDTMNRGYARMILYTDAGITLKLTDQLYFLGGFQTMFDFIWSGGDCTNHATPLFFAGLQFYPGIGDLSFSLAYALGVRHDWEDLNSRYRKIDKTKWGNGFRLAVEYDFKKGKGIIPVVGASYIFLPTGYNNYDNTLAVYFRLAFH